MRSATVAGRHQRGAARVEHGDLEVLDERGQVGERSPRRSGERPVSFMRSI